ncbi:hypothetical protein BHM03_00035188 [Ensete ventricosum]|nr:hypothetical protein BHM03_00035188 [Ensete ventricosum]
MSPKPLDYETLNENVKKVAYAVRGELYLRASELQKEGKKVLLRSLTCYPWFCAVRIQVAHELEFFCRLQIIFTNVGNPHALGQKPLTFPRQVVALCQAPFLLDDPNVGILFPADAIARAKHYLSLTSGGLGTLLQPFLYLRKYQYILKEFSSQQMSVRYRFDNLPDFCDVSIPGSKEVQLVSFHTVSKGYWGECGQRGGYFEMTNIPAKMGLMVNPPKPGDISYLRFVAESKAILESLKRRAHIMTDGFNSCRNVVCNFTEVNKSFLLDRVFHLRTTILPAEEDMPAIMTSFKKFNDEFMEQYEDYRGYSRM